MKKREKLYLVQDDTFIETEEMIEKVRSHSYFQSDEYKKELKASKKEFLRKINK